MEERKEIDWSKSHCGVMLCTLPETIRLMPEVEPIIFDLLWSGMLEAHPDEYLADVKVHMLMPNQYPCIPNWHRDFLPRDSDNKRVRGIKPSKKKMYMWVSGDPLTEYRSASGEIYTKPAREWHSFTQWNVHRGAPAKSFTWRCFIRVIPKEFVHECTKNMGTVRRHCQVYLDPEKFSW